MTKKKALITDIDNTLFDWFTMWHRSFNAMIDAASNISGVAKEELYSSAQRLHQKYGTAEYAFLLEELQPLLNIYGNKSNLLANIAPAIEAYRSERKKNMILYPGVLETLQELKSKGVLLLAFSESKAYYSSYRIAQLGLDGIIDIVFCPGDHGLPSSHINTKLLEKTECHILDEAFKKPNREILLKILADSHLCLEKALYVGDSKSKDIKMAIDTGIDYLWFEHGSNHLNARQEDYALLRKVTHWTDLEVEAERILAEDSKILEIDPSRVIQTYNEVLQHIG